MRCWREGQTYSAESWGRWGGWCWSLWCTHRSGSCSPGSGPVWGTDTQRCPANQHQQLISPLPPFLTKTSENSKHYFFIIFSFSQPTSPSKFCISHLDPSPPPKPHNVASISKSQLFPLFFLRRKHPEDEAEGSHYLAYGNNFHRESAFVVVDITVNVVGDQTLGGFGSVNKKRIFSKQEGHHLDLGTKCITNKNIKEIEVNFTVAKWKKWFL